MRIRWTRRRLVFAAVLCLIVWGRPHPATQLVYDVRLGQTSAEVMAIMGKPQLQYPNAFNYG